MGELKSLFAENFAPFADRIDFTCESVSNQKNHQKNTFSSGDTELNLVSYLYGANGSGKSYFCKIFQTIQDTIESSILAVNNHQNLYNKSTPNNKLQPKSFSLDIEYFEKPSSFGIELIIDNILYHYEFSIYKNEIIREILQKKKRRTETILNRSSSDFKNITVKSELKNFESIKHVVRNDALCLPFAAIFNNPLAMRILESINQISILNMTAPWLNPPNAELLSEDKMHQYIEIIKKIDPTITKMNASISEDNPTKQVNNSSDNLEDRESIQSLISVGIKTEHWLFEHGNTTGKTTSDINFFTEDSLGTVKLFTTLPYLFDVLENGYTIVLDEVENGLHLKLVKEIINLFQNKDTNPKNAQLICTSHQPLLLDGTNPKRDQVWIFHKDHYGKCKLNRLSNDSSARLQSNLSNRIIEGALGCNPEPFFTDNIISTMRNNYEKNTNNI